jgi:uncharacterized membrane protein HdeD (DUF308 family)
MAASQRSYQHDSMVEAVTTSWQIELLVGVVTLILGFLVAFHPTTSLNVICVLIGIMVILGGVFRLIRSLNPADTHRALSALAGVVMIVAGVVLIRHLHVSRLAVALVIGIVFIIQGVIDLLVGFSGEAREGRAWPIIIGLISLAAGIVVLAVPETSVTFLAVLVGIWFIVIGVLECIGAFVLRHALKKATTT